MQTTKLLHLESTRSTTTTSHLELAGLALEVGTTVSQVRAGLGVWHTRSLSEVAVHLAGLDSTTKEDAVGTGRRHHSQLIESQALSASLLDTRTSSFGETQSAHLHGRQIFDHTEIVGDGSRDNGDLIRLLGHVAGQVVNGHRCLLDTSHAQTHGDAFVELGVSTATQELVQLDQKLQVWVVAVNFRTTVRSDTTTSLLIDTHFV